MMVLPLIFSLVSCATNPGPAPTAAASESATGARTPSNAADLTGDYLGEGLFFKRTEGLRRPAMRMYLERVEGESDSYYGVLVEYDQLLKMAAPYLASQKAPALNSIVGYLNSICTQISAFKFVPTGTSGSYEMHNLEVHGGKIVPAAGFTMTLVLKPNNTKNALAGAMILGNADGNILFPDGTEREPTVWGRFVDAVTYTQYELAKFTYKMGHLKSTWRGNYNDLEGSYLSEYGRVKDGVLELSSTGQTKQARFTKTNRTKAKYFTNPKSAYIEGDYVVSEPIPKMYVLVPTQRTNAANNQEMTGRIGLFLDVFDGSAPEAGSHLVTELAFTNPQDPEDFMMYYEHADHAKNVGVEPPKKK